MILAMLEVQEKEAAAEEETVFEKEMQKRFDDYEQGWIIPLSLDELGKRTLNNYRKRTQSQK
jgi:hypothetical protein